MSVADLSFLADARAWVGTRASKNTRAAYLRAVCLWKAHCLKAGADPDAPDMALAVTFRERLRETMAPLTVRRVLAALSAAHVAVRPATTNLFSARALPRPPAPDYGLTEAISDADARLVVEAAGRRGKVPLRDRALLLVLWETGLRRGDVVTVRREHVVEREGAVLFRRHAVKGGREELTELPREASEAVRAWLAAAPPSRWLFCTLDGSKALEPQSVGRVVEKAAHVAGVKAHPHQFRAAFATRALDAGVRLERVQRAMHHRNPATTLRYDRGERGTGVVAELAAFRATAVPKP